MHAIVTLVSFLVFAVVVIAFVTRASQRVARLAWLLTLTLVLGGGVTMMVAHSFVAKWGFRGDSPHDGLAAMIEGKASRPFVYRRLTPDVVGLVSDFVAPRVPQSISQYLVERSPLGRYRATWGSGEVWTPSTALTFHVAFVVFWFALFGALVSGSALICVVRACPWFDGLITATVAMCLVPLMFVNGGYLYDSTELWLWSTLLLVAMRGPLPLLPIVFGLMIANKESALLGVPALFPLVARRTTLRTAGLWCLGLAVIGVGWIVFVRHRYADQNGDNMAWLLVTNLDFWTHVSSYFKFGTPYTPILPAPRGGNLLLILLAFLPLRFGWPSVRRDVRLATAIILSILVPLFLTSGATDEVRAFGLAYPLVFLVCVEGATKLRSRLEAPQQRA
jgi:hypothetical protein